ncbi:phosphoglucomutase/phosphomannomutase family protein [Caldithrix abyssi]
MIRFGTDGWRAVLAREFTFDNVGRVADAFSRFLIETSERLNGVVVSFDTRFLSERFARYFAEVVASYDIPVALSKKFTPTPALSFAVKQLKFNAGVMITASHNPYFYNGIKFKAAYGGPVLNDFTQQIEKRLDARSPKIDPLRVKKNLQEVDIVGDYFRQIKTLLNPQSLASFKKKMAYDAMFGCGMGFLSHFFEAFNLQAQILHGEENPLFNRTPPEPVARNLSELSRLIARGPFAIGLATDGDADRCALLDEKGQFVQLHDLLPLLAEYLFKIRGWDGNIVRTTSMHHTIDRLMARYGKSSVEVPVGFKNVCEVMLKQEILIGAEESGGFGFGKHLPERDGILTLLLALEMLGYYQAPISALVNDLRQKFGPFHYLRKDFYGEPELLKANLLRLRTQPPQRVAGMPVEKVALKDGLKLYLENGTWALFRVSQTEPLARIYVGGAERDAVKKALDWGVAQMTQKQAGKRITQERTEA